MSPGPPERAPIKCDYQRGWIRLLYLHIRAPNGLQRPVRGPRPLFTTSLGLHGGVLYSGERAPKTHCT
jgi:hypothetical protein